MKIRSLIIALSLGPYFLIPPSVTYGATTSPRVAKGQKGC